MTEEISKAASLYRIGRYRNLGIEPEYVWSDIDAAFEAGAAWQKERTSQLQLDAKPAALGGYDAECEFYSEIRDAIGTLGEGMAATLQGIKSLQATALRGADRDVAILKHLQEIGDNVRGVSSAIGDKFGVLLDAVKDVGEKVEACMTIASNTEEGLSVSIEKLDKLGVEKWREAIKHVGETTEGYDYSHGIHDDNGNYLPCSKAVYELFVSRGITEPMHAEVKAEPVIIESNPEAPGDWVKSAFMRGKVKAADYDESGLGKLWADVTLNLEDVSDKVLKDLFLSDQIPTSRYMEEVKRREKPSHFERVDADKIAIGKPATVRDVLTAIEAVAELASVVGVRLDWRVTVGAI